MAETLTLPGFVDVHVHLREPGDNKSETIQNGSKAAALGGFVLVCDMPNNPGNPTWSEDRLNEKIDIVYRDGTYADVNFYSGSQPEFDNIAELEGMAKKSVGLKLYGAPTTGNLRSYEAHEFEPIVAEWHRVAPQKPILFHAGRDNLDDMVELVADKYEHAFHVCHVNDPGQVKLVSDARQKDLPVTCGVCPHHLIKTSHDVLSEGEFARMQPPLTHQADSEKLMRQLSDGDIQIIESDYAPHSKEAKWEAEESGGSCFGVPGIEHIVPLLLRLAIRENQLDLGRLIDAMHTQPLRMLGLKLPKEVARSTWQLDDYRVEDEKDLASGAGWSPYMGKLLTGRLVEMTTAKRKVVEAGKLVENMEPRIE
jgi:dihydroorotase